VVCSGKDIRWLKLWLFVGCTVNGREWQFLWNVLQTTWEGFCGRFITVLLCDDVCYHNIMFSCCAGIMFGLVVKVRWNVLNFQAADQKVMTKASRRKLIVLKPLIQVLLHYVNLGREKGHLSEGSNNKENVSCLWIKLITVIIWNEREMIHKFMNFQTL